MYSQIVEDEGALTRGECTCVFWVNLSIIDLFIYPSTQAIHYKLVKTYLIIEL